jgi:hypothetical protein
MWYWYIWDELSCLNSFTLFTYLLVHAIKTWYTLLSLNLRLRMNYPGGIIARGRRLIIFLTLCCLVFCCIQQLRTSKQHGYGWLNHQQSIYKPVLPYFLYALGFGIVLALVVIFQPLHSPLFGTAFLNPNIHLFSALCCLEALRWPIDFKETVGDLFSSAKS